MPFQKAKMTKDEYNIFIAGWQAHKNRILSLISEYSSSWLPNGPSKAVANAIVSKINAVPVPKNEESF